MVLQRRPLTSRLPEDVRVRLQKAGVDDIEWYAGRLDPDAPALSKMSRDREAMLRKRAAARQDAALKATAKAAVRKMTARLRRRSSPARHATP